MCKINEAERRRANIDNSIDKWINKFNTQEKVKLQQIQLPKIAIIRKLHKNKLEKHEL